MANYKNVKRLLGIALCLVMLVGLFPLSALADDTLPDNGQNAKAPACICEAFCASGNGDCPVCVVDFGNCKFSKPTCYCAEKYTENDFNASCDICSADYAACKGTDTARGYASITIFILEYGSVSADKPTPTAGETVTLTVTPAVVCELEALEPR